MHRQTVIKWFYFLAAAAFSWGCVHQEPSSSTTYQHLKPSAQVWFQGSVEEAFRVAQQQDRPLFVYWGAVWCPPCNEIKSNVFARAEFAELMRPFIPVYLDGDSEAAQIWGEKLKASGYPTILVIGADKKELTRIDGGVDFEEFKVALATVLAVKRPFSDVIADAMLGKATTVDWQFLSHLSWSQVPEFKKIEPALLKVRLDLLAKIPSNLIIEKSAMISQTLPLGAQLKAKYDHQVDTLLGPQVESLLDAVLQSYATIRSARSMLLYDSKEVLALVPEAKRSQWQQRWLQAVQQLADDTSLSVDTRLWSVYPSVVLASDLDSPQSVVVKQVVERVNWADRQATSEYQRHSTISGAAYLLRQVRQMDMARQLLMKEIKTTATPWYYQSALASLESASGNKGTALKWLAEARQSAQGRATRLQWMAKELSMTIDVDSEDTDRITELLEDYYQQVFFLDDGWAGRNQRSTASVERRLRNVVSVPQVKELVQRFSARCNLVSETDGRKKLCQEHFSGLLAG